ncbi:MAG TPA: response regulator transcription factor [Jatrophihabitantaceae bacterium]|jgi:DNA-binding response OmpR family regulator|nr:response regulator transcription factor [Jatrophihabitantaceae bacterium]
MSPAGGPHPGVASSVLIADDDDDICALVAAILTRAGFHTETVDGGREALAAARREAPQLYVLDVRMPDINGLDVCRELKSNDETNGPVLLISAESSTDDVAAGYAAGCDDYLPKPFSSSELVRRVDQLLANETS